MIILKDEKFSASDVVKYMDLIENDPKFNSYKISKNIPEVQVVPYFGVILIYTKNHNPSKYIHTLYAEIESQNEQKLNSGEKIEDEGYRYLYRDILPFGNLQKKLKKKERVIVELTELKQFSIVYKNIDSTFVWFIKLITPNVLGYLSYTNEPRLRTHESWWNQMYLPSAASTIIYDMYGLFKEPIKQLDFPTINQYSCNSIGTKFYGYCDFMPVMTKKFTNILVSQNIILHYLQINREKYKNKFLFYDYEIRFDLPKSAANFSYNSVSSDICDGKKCFISGAPLFGYFREYNVKYTIKNKEHNDTLYINSDWLFTTYPSLIKYKDKTLEVHQFINSVYKTERRAKNIKVKAGKLHYADNIKEIINKMNVEQNYKNLLISILDNGLECTKDVNKNNLFAVSYVCYSVNLETNQIFVGLTNITDSIAMKYNNSSTVLYLIDRP